MESPKLIEELDEVTLRALKKMDETKVEVSLREPKVQGFLKDLMELCSKHHVAIAGTEVSFLDWDSFGKLEADSEGVSLYWSRIQTEIVVRRKNEKHSEMVSDTKTTSQT